MAWVACGIVFVLISGTFLAPQANLAPEQRLFRSVLVVLGGFCSACLGMLSGVAAISDFQSCSIPRGATQTKTRQLPGVFLVCH